jgi:drug/metabolite transporter (DMT)-like permease
VVATTIVVTSRTTTATTTTTTPTDIFATASDIQGGMERGTYLFIGNALRVIGLKTVASDRAAFLLQLTTIFVPLVQCLLSRCHFNVVPLRTWIASGIALLGVALIGMDGTTTGSSGNNNNNNMDHTTLVVVMNTAPAAASTFATSINSWNTKFQQEFVQGRLVYNIGSIILYLSLYYPIGSGQGHHRNSLEWTDIGTMFGGGTVLPFYNNNKFCHIISFNFIWQF